MRAIGYRGAAYSKGIRELAIRRDLEDQAYPPTLENVMVGRYPGSRHLYIYLKERPKGVLKDLLDWTLSDEGKEIVEQVGYFPLR